MLAGVAMLHWFCTSALSTCGSVLLCSIVYYPRDGFYVLSVQCGLHSVQIKCCSIYGGQENSMGERVVKHETMLAACVCLWPR